jgi:hypothetical protein
MSVTGVRTDALRSEAMNRTSVPDSTIAKLTPMTSLVAGANVADAIAAPRMTP